MTGNSSLFSNLDKSIQTNVTLGNNARVTVLGKGIVGILTKKIERKVMPNIYYVDGVKQNLLSIGQLT